MSIVIQVDMETIIFVFVVVINYNKQRKLVSIIFVLVGLSKIMTGMCLQNMLDACKTLEQNTRELVEQKRAGLNSLSSKSATFIKIV